MKFSSRLPAQIQPSSLARLIEKARAERTDFLDLTESNPTHAGIPYPVREILAGFGDAKTSEGLVRYEPEPFGLRRTRELVAELEGVPADRVVLTTSTSEAYSWLFKLLCDPGDEVLTPRPSYPLFEHLAALESVAIRHYPLHYHGGWFTDIAALNGSLNDRSKAIVAVSPNNPTGSYLKADETAAIADVCARNGLAFIVDEVFRDYELIPGMRESSWTSAPANALTFRLNGLSKMLGMPQMKLGWMTISGLETVCAEALQRLELIADTYLSVGTPVQLALPALLGSRQSVQSAITAHLRENLDYLRASVAGSAASLLDVEAGWYAVVRVPQVWSEEQWVSSLVDQCGVLVQPGYFYDFEKEGYLILSLLTPPAVFAEGVSRTLKLIYAATSKV